jgi:hypothetical protein
MKPLGLCLSVLFAVAACGGTHAGGGSTSVTGTVSGTAVPTNDTIALVGPVSVTDPTTGLAVTVQELLVLVSNAPNLCALAVGKHNPPNVTSLGISVGSLNPIVAGTFPVGSATADPAAGVAFTTVDATCNATTNQQGTGGTVTISAITSTTVTGTFDALLMSGDHLRGSFVAPVCSADLNALMNSTTACGG